MFNKNETGNSIDKLILERNEDFQTMENVIKYLFVYAIHSVIGVFVYYFKCVPNSCFLKIFSGKIRNGQKTRT